MPAIEIRPAIATDIPMMIALDHHYTTDHVWQMDTERDNGEISIRFREVRLPRAVRVEYPRSPKLLADDWDRRSGLLVALLNQEIVGYVSLMRIIAPKTIWMTDLVVTKPLRRQGIGSALVLAAQEWTTDQTRCKRLVLEIQPKNYAAINLAHKLGYNFTGFDDHHFANNDIGIFFAKWLR